MKKMLLAASAAMTACGAEATAPDMSEFGGNYTLQTLNGQSLPPSMSPPPSCMIRCFGNTYTLRGLVITVKPNGTWESVAAYTDTVFGREVNSTEHRQNGTWTRSGTSVIVEGETNRYPSVVKRLTGTASGSTMDAGDAYHNAYHFTR